MFTFVVQQLFFFLAWWHPVFFQANANCSGTWRRCVSCLFKINLSRSACGSFVPMTGSFHGSHGRSLLVPCMKDGFAFQLGSVCVPSAFIAFASQRFGFVGSGPNLCHRETCFVDSSALACKNISGCEEVLHGNMYGGHRVMSEAEASERII